MPVLSERNKWIVVSAAGVALVAVFYFLDPDGSQLFPKCPFYWLTGYKCPGCGSQRAIHHLLHFDFAGAFHANALLVVSLPYILLAFLFDLAGLKYRWPRARKILFGKWAIMILVIIVMVWWIGRNFW